MTPATETTSRFAHQKLVEGCDALETLLLGLLETDSDTATQIHAIRKLGKSLRGGFALFHLKHPACEIQAIGRLLSESRDAVSRLKTWELLEWNHDPKTAAAIRSLLLHLTHSAARRPPAESIDWCLLQVTSARSTLRNLADDNLHESLTTGLRKLSKQVRKRCIRLDHGSEHAFHDARKALKAYLGAVGFLPPESAPPIAEMADIAELLGDENDLATLSCWLANHGFTPRFAPHLWKQISQTRHKLQKRCIRKAESLFLPGHP